MEWVRETYGFRKREGMRSSRSNWTSSKAAAMPYQPGMAAASVRHTCAIVAMTTLPRPKGLRTSTISSSIEAPTGSCLGQRKKTPVELMSRVTRVTGDSSGTPPAPRRRNGRFSVARGYSRCSGSTPTACVGTLTNRRGCVGPVGPSSGATRRVGTRGTSASDCAPATGSRAFAAGLPDHDSNGGTRFVAPI